MLRRRLSSPTSKRSLFLFPPKREERRFRQSHIGRDTPGRCAPRSSSPLALCFLLFPLFFSGASLRPLTSKTPTHDPPTQPSLHFPQSHIGRDTPTKKKKMKKKEEAEEKQVRRRRRRRRKRSRRRRKTSKMEEDVEEEENN